MTTTPPKDCIFTKDPAIGSPCFKDAAFLGSPLPDLTTSMTMLLDGADRTYLQAMGEICSSLKDTTIGSPRFKDTPIRSPCFKDAAIVGSPRKSSFSCTEKNIAMVRLEDEFRNILVTRTRRLEMESLSTLSTMSSVRSEEYSNEHSDYDTGVDEDLKVEGVSSICHIELLPASAVQNLRSIAERMISSGYSRECVEAYGSIRKSDINLCFCQLGVEKLSIGDVQRLGWDTLEPKISRWIHSSKICIRVIFANERHLCEGIFGALTPRSNGSGPFAESVKGPAIQLFSFPEAISISRRSPEKLFRILELHDAISDLLPDIAFVFCSTSVESIYTQAAEILTRLTEAVRGILSEFENSVFHHLARMPVPGGTIHPLTRYVMNYLSLISDYKTVLNKLILTKPSARDLPETENQSPLASHLIWVIVLLQSNLENKANMYKDPALSYLFQMNNVHYIAKKVNSSPELRELIGDRYLRRLTEKIQQFATSYERSSWVNILHCLREEGTHVSGSFSSGVSKSTLKERFKCFNAAFDEVYRAHVVWSVPDSLLREELRISISEKLLPAYRSFIGRFRQYIESGRHPGIYIKYSVEDLEVAVSDLFEGCQPSLNRWKKSNTM